ncbi:DUF4326 domain-containing protein [Streptomyces sp. NPDC101455]|uniref:DUF4326 domain-containing protein n=1 Tax=Streptomyces sp. NPDC101455 TaxID=3366142 RepID=UPI0037F43E9E
MTTRVINIRGHIHEYGPRRDGTRAEVMAMYRAYLPERPYLLELVPALRGRVLACWCAPLVCHAGVLAELVDDGEFGK